MRGTRYIILFAMLLFAGLAKAQEEGGNETGEKITAPAVSLRADSLFASLKPNIDSTYLQKKNLVKTTFWTRLSFQTNMVDWAATLPNFGVEFDLSKSYRNKRSLFGNIKYNGMTKENHHPKFVFNYMQVRAEYRKYWRTGNIGRERDYPEYKKLNLHKPDSLYKDTFRISYPSGDTIRYKHAYFDSVNQRIDEEYNGDPNRSWFYNHYHKARRRISTRTITEPRNWRAYYLGAYVLADKYALCFGKKGNEGTSFGFGATAGWSIPLLPKRFPKEGGLDLDLGVNMGLRVTRNQKFRYDEEFRDYQITTANAQFKFVPFPMIDEIRIGLVYRFRSIAYKVDLSIVDDYKKVISRFEERKTERKTKLDSLRLAWDSKVDSIHGKQSILNDSLSFWVPYQKRRLKNAWALNPDTIFHDRDSVLEAELFPDSVKARIERKIAAEKAAKLAAKQKKIDEKNQKKQAKLQAKEDEKAEKEKEKADKKAKKNAEPQDSIAEPQDSITVPEPTEQPDSLEAPSAPEASEQPENPEAPEAPEAPEQPENPEAPEAPEQPENPEAPEAPEAPENPENPEEGGEE